MVATLRSVIASLPGGSPTFRLRLQRTSAGDWGYWNAEGGFVGGYATEEAAQLAATAYQVYANGGVTAESLAFLDTALPRFV